MKRTALPAITVFAFALGACQPTALPNDPIIARVRANDIGAVEAFIARGGDINMTDREGNPLIFLASGPQGGVEVTATLLAAGARVDAKSASGRTPLENAVGWCDIQMVQLLLFAGADPIPLGGDRAEEVACKEPLDRRLTVLVMIAEAIEDRDQ